MQKKTLKTFLEINFVYASLWLFLRIKKTDEFVVDIRRFKHWENPGTNKFTDYFMNAVPVLVKESILFLFITTTNRLLINNQKAEKILEIQIYIKITL